jgi:hypothetical protein
MSEPEVLQSLPVPRRSRVVLDGKPGCHTCEDMPTL